MNLPIIFVLAKSSLVSIFIWIAIMVFFAIMEFLKRAKKSKAQTISQSFSQPQTEPAPDRPKQKRKKETKRQSFDSNSSFIGYDEAAFNPDDSDESATPASAGDQQNAPKISINSRDELKKAIIYHEIMDPKF